MRNKVKIGLIQMMGLKDKRENLSKAVSMIDKAADKGANIICLPELFTSFYFPQYKRKSLKDIAETIPGETTTRLSVTAKKNKIILVGGSICEKAGNKIYNTSCIFNERGGLIGKYRKIHIPHDPGFYEKNYFDEGNLGYIVRDTRHGGIASMICYDQWYPEGARINALMGADILFYPTAIGAVTGMRESEGSWQKAWEAVQVGHAIANGSIVCAVNRVGREDKINFWGSSFIVNQFGTILAKGGNKEEIVMAECDLSLGKKVKKDWGFIKNRRPDTYNVIARPNRMRPKQS